MMFSLPILSAFIAILVIFLARPKLGMYLMAFLLPVIGFELAFLSFSFPLIDFTALALLIAFLLRLAWFSLFDKSRQIKIKFPLLLPFGLFLIVSLASALLATDIGYSVWYFIRWPLFLYFAYIFVPYNLIDDQKTLKQTIITATASSLLVLIFGFLSLYGQDWRDSFFRIRSLSLAGIYPFGENHNLIAEFLNVGSFFILSLRLLAKDNRVKRFLDVIFALSVLGIIMTFSRSGWLVLFLQAAIYAIIFLKDRGLKKRDFVIPALLLAVVLSPLFLKMDKLQESNTSSTENRWLLTEIAIEAANEKPILGYGSGYFIKLVDNNLRFRVKYGEAIDSHGILQKVIAENGLLGLLAWLFILAYLLKTFFIAIYKHSAKSPWLTPLILGASGGLFFQFLNTSYYKGKVWLPIVLALLAVELLDKNYQNERNRK